MVKLNLLPNTDISNCINTILNIRQPTPEFQMYPKTKKQLASELKSTDQIVGSDNTGGKLKYGRARLRLRNRSIFV